MKTYGIFNKDDHMIVRQFEAADQKAAFIEAYTWINCDSGKTDNDFEIAQISSDGYCDNVYDLAYHRSAA